MKQPLFALIDCNNFFVSCERIFRPDLEGKPVVVLSSNDGCAVARSNEAKALGIPMGAPAFKYRDLFKREGVISFSGNFELYGDTSRRITEILTTITPRLEVYSVDESFLDLSELPIRDYTAWGKTIRETILKWVGVPVSIGVAPSKTLAKLASDYAKKHPETGGVLDWAAADKTQILQSVPLKDIWGIGWRLAPKLQAENLMTAYDIAALRPQRAQQLMGIHGRQMVAELNGISCYPLELEHKARQSIARTRTFGEDVHDINTIEAAIANFVARAAHRLRVSGQLTRRAGLFLATNRHKPGYTMVSRGLHFETPTADTGFLIHELTTLLHQARDPRQAYYRAGVYMWDFVPKDHFQADIFGQKDPVKYQASKQRMDAIDALNERYGRQTLRWAAEDLGQSWHPRKGLRSPHYTTSWDDLPKLHII